MLQHADVMITHGGINSILECIHFRVPMVIVPGIRDQPGAAARASYHKIAVLESSQHINAARLYDKIQRAMTDPEILQSLNSMRQMINDEPGLNESVAWIEETAKAG